MNTKICTHREFRSFFITILLHLSLVEIFNVEINPDEYLNLSQIIRHLASSIELNLITSKLILPR